MLNIKKLGIIAGSGNLPAIIANTFNNPTYIAQISEPEDVVYHNSQTYIERFSIGEVGKILNYFSTNDAHHIVMAGGIKRPNFTSLKVDELGRALVYRIIKSKFLGDDQLLRIVAEFLEDKGFNIISAQDIVKNSTLPQGVATIAAPSIQELASIELGKIEAIRLGRADLGQSVIIEGSIILGVESKTGTDALIQNCKAKKKHHNSGVLVKMMKPQQDQRLDIPTIGINTVINISSAGLAGIAIEANRVIVIDPEETINMANKLGIFIIGI